MKSLAYEKTWEEEAFNYQLFNENGRFDWTYVQLDFQKIQITVKCTDAALPQY